MHYLDIFQNAVTPVWVHQEELPSSNIPLKPAEQIRWHKYFSSASKLQHYFGHSNVDMSVNTFFQNIISIKNQPDFEKFAIELFQIQYRDNPLYHNYCNALKIAPGSIQSVEKIPFLPIEFFKSHEVRTGLYESQKIFTSSGTTSMTTSRHHVKNIHQYEVTFLEAFKKFYGEPSEWVVLGLLPSYLERSGSSLVYMVEKLIAMSQNPDSGFFLYNHEDLEKTLVKHNQTGQKCLLIGVTFALLDFAEKRKLHLKNTVIMETGGMKGRGEELTREEVTEKLKNAFGVAAIHSEYGMTELLSQAYSCGHGLFKAPNWLKILVRDTSDPFSVHQSGSGALNIIDLANTDSMAFIATQDLGLVHEDGSFEVKGRLDNSDARGCNMLIL